jgi:hypothetical protein
VTPYDDVDAVVACANLADRAGATGFEIGYTREGVPVEDAGWYAYAIYHGAWLTAQELCSPADAAEALARRILEGGRCRCGRPSTVSPLLGVGCLWRREGRAWVSSCNAPSVRVEGRRGDLEAMRRAMTGREQERPW